MQVTYTMYMRGGIFPNGSFGISGHIYCPLSDGLDADLAHMEINGTVSALCGWEGEGTFVRQKKGLLELDYQCVLQGGLGRAWTGVVPRLYSYLSVCTPCSPVLLRVLSCDPSSRAGENPARKSW